MRRYSSRQNLQTLTEINITPLLDLAFVLLIIFMITTPLIENSIELVVPTSSTAKKSVDPSEVLTISIDKNDVMKLNAEIVTPTDLEARLATLHAANPATAVVVRPDRDLAVQKFVSVMDILQRIGITKVGVMTHPEQPVPTNP
ncbi:MAG: biopolymer transporter ExbD [Chthoniobacterales bacterium]|nr:biopolymer transporter ExbD [Chthoniobacterales bacterium]